MYIFQGDRYLDHVEKVETYNRVMSEQTDEDVVKYIEQQKKISKFSKYVREHTIGRVGVLKVQPREEEPAEPIELAPPSPPEQTAEAEDWEPVNRALEDL